MSKLRTKWIVITSTIVLAGLIRLDLYPHQACPPPQADQAVARAINFLTIEVPAWSKNNGCFSCHNNGDAARALYVATRRGYRLPGNILADTTFWLSRPNRWEQNKGDPGFSDKRLANIQFAAALIAAFEAGLVKDQRPLAEAARKLAADQEADGSWRIDTGKTLGSPATYGTLLATHMALNTLKKASIQDTREAVQKAERWLSQAQPDSILAAATLLLTMSRETSTSPREEEILKIMGRAQTRDGGWGPYADSPPEPFDTAVALLALKQYRQKLGVNEMIERGRSFLVAQQNPDGSWPATTRPAGGESYAQSLSTTGWATLALLETKD
jgi:Prenyltransferase and squalene oxidase repeat